MPAYDTTKFRQGLDTLHIELSEEQIEKFLTYYEKLIEWNSFMNLTAITEYDEVINKHFLDSLSIVRDVDFSKVQSMVDVGTGAGFPGIPLAIAFPDVQILLVDSLGKRVKFLNEVIETLKLENVQAVHSRAEDAGRNKTYREHFDLVVSRAVANLSTLTEYCIPFAKVEGLFVSYKSNKASEEIQEAANAFKILGCRVRKTDSFQLADTDNERTLIVIKKEKPTPGKYPRKAGTPSAKPL